MKKRYIISGHRHAEGGGEKGDRLPPKFPDNLLRFEKVYFRNLYLWFKHIWLELLQKVLKSDLKTHLKRSKINNFLP